MDAPKILTPPWSGKSGEIISKDITLLSRSYNRSHPIVIKEARDGIVIDVNDNRFIDFSSGGGLLTLGGSHPRIIEAVKRQLDATINFSLRNAYSSLAVELGEELSKILPIGGDVRFLYVNSGSEAVEAALRVFRLHTLREHVIGFLGGFHGSTQGAASISSHRSDVEKRTPKLNIHYIPYPYCYRCPIGHDSETCGEACIEYLTKWVLERAVHPSDVSCIVFEPIQIHGGVIVPPDNFWERFIKSVREAGIPVVADETYSSPARTGRWTSIELWRTQVDAVLLGPPLSSGLPLGVLAARGDFMDLEPGQFDSTSGGCLVSLAAALETLRVIRDEGLVERSERMGRNLLRRIKDACDGCENVGEIRGKGLLIGVEIVEDRETKNPDYVLAKKIADECFRVGLIVERMGNNLLLRPPLNMDEKFLEKGAEILETKIMEVSTWLSRAF